MRNILMFIVLLLLVFVGVCGYSFLTDKTTYTSWEIKREHTDSSGLSWAAFNWAGDSIGGTYNSRLYMLVPAKMDDLPYRLSFQFDLGADKTGVYENSIHSFSERYPALNHQIQRLRSPLQFWNKNKLFRNAGIRFGDFLAQTKNAFVYKNYGETFRVPAIQGKDVYSAGTIGADLFQNKVLVLDYPRERFAICDSVPAMYQTNLVPVTLDPSGRIILSLRLNQKIFNVLFDNGSSMFPLLVTDNRVNEFSTLPGTDTISINSWGKRHNVIGRKMPDSFELAGKNYAGIMVYADYRKEARTNSYDAIAGNALFWDKTLVLDFKNKRVGIY